MYLEVYSVEEFARLTVCSRENESQGEFNKRLIDFWTRFLRVQTEEYKRVYAETARFEIMAAGFARQYLVGCEICSLIQSELLNSRIDFEPIDEDDLYSKYEATPPEWFQIPH